MTLSDGVTVQNFQRHGASVR